MQVTKFLGVLIDSKISWIPQILNVKAKLAKCTSVLFKAKHLVDLSTMKLLYNSLFLPYIDYCSEVWGNTYVTKLNCIILLQKRAIRIVANVSKYYHTNELFKQLKLLKFLDHVKFKSGVFMYNAYHYKLPTKLQLLFNKGSNSQHCTRQHNKFKVFFISALILKHYVYHLKVQVFGILYQLASPTLLVFLYLNIS